MIYRGVFMVWGKEVLATLKWEFENGAKRGSHESYTELQAVRAAFAAFDILSSEAQENVVAKLVEVLGRERIKER